MDGSGNQINISTRGLDPHRGWEFNIRKNGIITNTDLYGYPASHFTLPMEVVERIELVQGLHARIRIWPSDGRSANVSIGIRI